MSLEDWIEDLKTEREEEFHTLEVDLDLTGITFCFQIRQGIPFEELFNATIENNVGMVVIGAKGKTNLADFFVGSTANKMFRRCPVPLVTVRKKSDKID